MRGDTVLGDAVHLVRADLDLERRTVARQHRRVQRLVHVRLGDGDVVLEPARKRLPHRVDRAEHRIAVADGVDDDAHRGEIVDLLKALALLHLAPNAVKVLGSAVDVALYAQFVEHLAQVCGDRVDDLLPLAARGRDLFGDHIVVFGVKIAQTEVLEFAFESGDTQPRRDRRIDVEGLRRDAFLVRLVAERQRTHVVQSVRQLDDDDADVVAHRKEHAPQIFRLLIFAALEVELVELGHALDEQDDGVPEFLIELLFGDGSVLDHVMQKRGYHRIGVKPEVDEDLGDRDRVDDVVVARLALLTLVRALSEVVRPRYAVVVLFAESGLDLGEEFFVIHFCPPSQAHGRARSRPKRSFRPSHILF